MREYVICSYYLYDNNKDTDYIILCDNERLLDSPFDKIYTLKNELGDTKEFHEKSIKLIEKACEFQTRFCKCTLVKNDGIMKSVLLEEPKTYNPSYNAYDIVWDEEKSNINPFEYNHFMVWNIGNSSISMYKTQDHVSNRNFLIRDNTLNSILDEV
jgi:hypothetical protein